MLLEETGITAADHIATYKTMLRINKGKTKIMYINYHREGAPSKALEDLEVAEDFKYLGAILASLLPDCRQRRGITWGNFWKLQTIWRSTSLYCMKSVQIRSFFWSVFYCIRTEYGPEKSPYLVTFHAVRTDSSMPDCDNLF